LKAHVELKPEARTKSFLTIWHAVRDDCADPIIAGISSHDDW
jgi:hypothetical protein